MNLRDFMKLRTRIKTDQALPLMIGIAEGLKYAMSQGVTHRDIKGTNILISNQGEAKLVDFGLATMQGDESRPGVKSQRTVDYSALERTCNSPKGDPRSDIYFLGCVFYQMVTGQLPMEEVESKDMLRKMLKRSFGAIKPINEHRYAPEEELGGIIEKMMRMDLKARYQTMDAVVAELEQFQADYEAAKSGGARRSKADEDEEFIESIFLPREIEKPYEAATAPPAPKPIPSKSILCVETQTEIRDAFRKTLSHMGYKVMLFSDAEVAAERYREATADAVIFDTDGQDEESIDAFIDMHEFAHEEGHQLVALVLLGHKQNALRERLPNDDRLIILNKPVKMKQVQDALQDLVPLH
jgi:serine/threonine protein kinase